ncbi:LLM class flavin-dependent oxidoreductase [Kineosporia sp. J2-2]|uniref:LLM class flavin-dependent oxidoreductase n=1 Tax=Kineosporia corallincola TaxID=2835133 RepID=A0ABS5TCM6_9ACTN|nr:LLM class flavin-dependent oxidoreductase [Kineosporia corallincola]MBT0768840.1 LLM class flavin-dependent oxidoreductase [Kineosporia corallincola]
MTSTAHSTSTTQASSGSPRLGVAFVPVVPPERFRSLVLAAEESGLDELWVWEDCFKESGVASAAVALAWTQRIRVGIGLMPAPLRNVALTAMEIATLERMFPGRLMPGVGHGVQDWMGQVGNRAASPLTLLREYATALRRLLHGEKVTVDGIYVKLHEVALDWPPVQPPLLYVGGEGPKTLRLTGEVGDGTMLSWAGEQEALRRTVQGVLDVAAPKPGARGPHEVTVGQIAATGPGAQARVDAELPLWGRQPGPGAGVAGDAATIAADVRRLGQAGCTTVILQPTSDEPDLEGFIRFLGQEVRPLLAG